VPCHWATGTISPNSKVHEAVVEFQRWAATTSLELELANGDALYGGRAELTTLFEPLTAAMEVLWKTKMN
jgi:hypothetical protein